MAGVQAEVRHRLRASNGNAPQDDEGGDDDSGDIEDGLGDELDAGLDVGQGREHDELATRAGESR